MTKQVVCETRMRFTYTQAKLVPGKKNDVHWLTPAVDNPMEVELHATEKLVCVVIAGKPLREPVAAKRPFVMNTEAQIKKPLRISGRANSACDRKTKLIRMLTNSSL